MQNYRLINSYQIDVKSQRLRGEISKAGGLA